MFLRPGASVRASARIPSQLADKKFAPAYWDSVESLRRPSQDKLITTSWSKVFLIIIPCPSLSDELARVVACKWQSDTEKVVLEISDPSKKKTTDAQVCSWRELFSDLEDEGHFEVTVNSHDVQKAPASSEDTSYLSLICVSFLPRRKNTTFFAQHDAHCWASEVEFCNAGIAEYNWIQLWLVQGEFYIRPKANEMFYSWGSVATNGIKFGSMASAFTGEAT